MSFDDLISVVHDEGVERTEDIAKSVISYLSESMYDWFDSLDLTEFDSAFDVVQNLIDKLQSMVEA